jgi:dipeptidyl aminopeptidase/acylaminoacyl peptidase
MLQKSLFFALLLTALPAPADDVTRWTTNGGQLILEDVPDIPPEVVRRLKQYQNVRSASFLGWTRNGRGMYIRTRFGELGQIHRLYSAAGMRQQLTWFSEPIGQVVRRDGHDELAITMDEGGGELDQILLFTPQSATTRRLTKGPSRNRLARWSRGGNLLAFQSTRRNGSSNDLWIMNPDDPERAELLLEAPAGSWLGPTDFSKENNYLLIQQFFSVDDSRVLLFDLRDRSIRVQVGGGEYPSANRAVAFDRKGTGFYFITNARGLAAELAWQSIDPEQETEFITSRVPWDVSDFAVSSNGSRGAFVTNEEGISKLYLLNTKNRRFTKVNDVPVGLVSNLEFNPDNRSIAFNLSTSQTPSDVYVLELGRRAGSAGALRRWSFSEVGGLDTADFARPKLIRYPTFDLVGEKPRKVPAFLYKPPGKGPHPVIIHVHGGPESQYRPAFSQRTQMWVGELGAAVIAPNIRGSAGYDSRYLALDNGSRREDAVHDIGALLDWIAAEPELDASRVAIFGASYGGYIVLASAVHYSDRLRAGVDIVGISNFVTFLENTEEYRRTFRRLEYGDERDPEMRAFLQQISPLSNADRIDIPLLVVQGRNDPRVPASESQQIVSALRQRGQPVWYIEALNEGHGYERKENRNVAEQASILFLRKYLLGQTESP